MENFVLVIKAIKTRLESGGKWKLSEEKRTLKRHHSTTLKIGGSE